MSRRHELNITCTALLGGLTAASLAVANPQAVEIFYRSNDLTVPPPGFPAGGVVWNASSTFSNLTLDEAGDVAFVGRIFDNDLGTDPMIVAGGSGVMGNDRCLWVGSPGNWTLISQSGVANPSLPGPAGFTFNTTTGTNGLSTSAPSLSPNGRILTCGNVNYGGVTSATDSAIFAGSVDTAFYGFLEGSHAGDEVGDVNYQSSLSMSQIRITNSGKYPFHANLFGTDTALPATGFTGTNMGVFIASPDGVTTFARRGDLAPSHPGLPEGTQLNTQDSFGAMINGAGEVVYPCRLSNDANPTSITTSNDRCILSSVGGSLHILAREGDGVPGMTGVTYAASTTGSPFNIALAGFTNAGSVLLNTALSGNGIVPAVNDYAVMLLNADGSATKVIQRGDPVAGATDAPFKFFNNTSFGCNNSGFVAGAGAFNITSTTNDEFVGAGMIGQPLSLIIREGEAVPGLPGVFCGGMQSSANLVINDANEVVFSIPLTGAVTTADNAAMMCWSAQHGLRVLLRKGDTTVIPGVALTNIAWNAANKDGECGSSCITDSGWVGLNLSYSGGAAIGRISIRPVSVCVGDFDQDGDVDGSDLAALLSGWGTSAGDLDSDGATSGSDLALLLGGWGDCN